MGVEGKVGEIKGRERKGRTPKLKVWLQP